MRDNNRRIKPYAYDEKGYNPYISSGSGTSAAKLGCVYVPCSTRMQIWVFRGEELVNPTRQKAAIAFKRAPSPVNHDEIRPLIQEKAMAEDVGDEWIKARSLKLQLVALYAMDVPQAKHLAAVKASLTDLGDSRQETVFTVADPQSFEAPDDDQDFNSDSSSGPPFYN
ncbi:hypothetical protein FRB90_000692 [Tulasnella sp. 427]|nr:hypothetical protein FRB90_000692 [Tulasnella sp. 427]